MDNNTRLYVEILRASALRYAMWWAVGTALVTFALTYAALWSALAAVCFFLAGAIVLVASTKIFRQRVEAINKSINCEQDLIAAARHCQDLERSLSDVCATCEGSGEVVTVRAPCYICAGSGVSARTWAVWNALKPKKIHTKELV